MSKTKQLTLSKLTCLRCGHDWLPRSLLPPVRCPNLKCQSHYWDRPRQPKKEGA